MTEYFGAQLSQVQLTLSALLLAFGISQLLWGPLSDKYGRRPVMLWGLSAYVVASIFGAMATSVSMVILARVFQGAALGASVMCARAVVRDLYAPQDGARIMSKGLTGLGIIACFSAPFGGFIAARWGWQAPLVANAVFGAFCVGLAAFGYRETNSRKNPEALHFPTLTRTWKSILTNKTFLAYSTVAATSYGVLFLYLTASSYVYIRTFKFPVSTYGWFMLTMTASYLVGTVLTRIFLRRVGLPKTVAIAGGLSLVGGTAIGLIGIFGTHTPTTVTVAFIVMMVGHGIHQPCGQAGAIGPFPGAAGTASAINGFVMMTMSFIVGAVFGSRLDGSVVNFTTSVWIMATLTAVLAWTLVQKYGDFNRK